MKYVNWPLKLAFSGRGQRKGNSQKVISSKYIVESECFFFFLMQRLYLVFGSFLCL